MRLAERRTVIHAPVEACYAAARDLDLRRRCDAGTCTIIAAEADRGLLNRWQELAWRSPRFAVWRRLPTEITIDEPPYSFSERMSRPLAGSWEHHHIFSREHGGTVMTDLYRYELPDVPPGPVPDDEPRVFLGHFIERLLLRRNALIKRIAEGDDFSAKFADDDDM